MIETPLQSMSNKGLWKVMLSLCTWYVHFASYTTILYYYLHQSFIIHAFLDDLWDFIQSLPFGISFPGDGKSLVFVFCCFKDLLDLKLIGNFYSLNILSREASGEVVAHERSYDAQMGKGGAAHHAGRVTRACLALEHRLVSTFLCTPSFRQKRDALFFP
jgi:hypothetical protein